MKSLDEFKNMNFDHIEENGKEYEHDIHKEVMNEFKDPDSDMLKF